MNHLKRPNRTGTSSNPLHIARGLLSDGSFTSPHGGVRTLGFSALQGPARHVGPVTHSSQIQAGLVVPGPGLLRPPGGTGHRVPANWSTMNSSASSSLHQQLERISLSASTSSFAGPPPPSARGSQPGPFDNLPSAVHGGKGKAPVARGPVSTFKPSFNQHQYHPLPPVSTGQVGLNTSVQRSHQASHPYSDPRSHSSGLTVASPPSTHSGSPYSGSSSSGGKLPGSLSTSLPRHPRDSLPQNLGPQGGVGSRHMEKGKRPHVPPTSTSTSRAPVFQPPTLASTSSRAGRTADRHDPGGIIAEKKYNLYVEQLNGVTERIRAVRRSGATGNLTELESERERLKSLMKTSRESALKAKHNQHWNETGSNRSRS